MLIALYFAMFVAGVLVCWAVSRMLKPEYWYVLIIMAVLGYLVNGFVFDPAIGYPPWQDDVRASSLANVGLVARAISWFSFSVIISGVSFSAWLLKQRHSSESSNKADPHGKG